MREGWMEEEKVEDEELLFPCLAWSGMRMEANYISCMSPTMEPGIQACEMISIPVKGVLHYLSNH